ncbi:Secretion system X translation initiation factor [Pararobbsia alpina]|uniref:hypothetical protein n=1 Tax=Pararobbsia alpina TaxID=621374 RepID=UPI0039A673B2
MKRNHVILALMFVSTAATLVFTRKNTSDDIVEAAPRTHAAAQPSQSSRSSHGGSTGTVGIAEVQTRATHDGADAAHRKVFGATVVGAPLPSAAPAGSDIPPLPTGPLVPDMPFTYIGKQSSDGRWEVYLSRGDDTLIVREQTIIDGAYRVESIAPPTMTLVYLPTKLVQTMDIGSAD